mmetsp:Transcript_9575/g.28820  ORF Transcript_9575/g.28820 Transcript_9575/m.28820 type:complete len:564 (-) Transcript_9575:30-1721(-)
MSPKPRGSLPATGIALAAVGETGAFYATPTGLSTLGAANRAGAAAVNSAQQGGAGARAVAYLSPFAQPWLQCSPGAEAIGGNSSVATGDELCTPRTGEVGPAGSTRLSWHCTTTPTTGPELTAETAAGSASPDDRRPTTRPASGSVPKHMRSPLFATPAAAQVLAADFASAVEAAARAAAAVSAEAAAAAAARRAQKNKNGSKRRPRAPPPVLSPPKRKPLQRTASTDRELRRAASLEMAACSPKRPTARSTQRQSSLLRQRSTPIGSAKAARGALLPPTLLPPAGTSPVSQRTAKRAAQASVTPPAAQPAARQQPASKAPPQLEQLSTIARQMKSEVTQHLQPHYVQHPQFSQHMQHHAPMQWQAPQQTVSTGVPHVSGPAPPRSMAMPHHSAASCPNPWLPPFSAALPQRSQPQQRQWSRAQLQAPVQLQLPPVSHLSQQPQYPIWEPVGSRPTAAPGHMPQQQQARPHQPLSGGPSSMDYQQGGHLSFGQSQLQQQECVVPAGASLAQVLSAWHAAGSQGPHICMAPPPLQMLLQPPLTQPAPPQPASGCMQDTFARGSA